MVSEWLRKSPCENLQTSQMQVHTGPQVRILLRYGRLALSIRLVKEAGREVGFNHRI